MATEVIENSTNSIDTNNEAAISTTTAASTAVGNEVDKAAAAVDNEFKLKEQQQPLSLTNEDAVPSSSCTVTNNGTSLPPHNLQNGKVAILPLVSSSVAAAAVPAVVAPPNGPVKGSMSKSSPKNILAKQSPSKVQVPIAAKPIAPSIAVPSQLAPQQKSATQQSLATKSNKSQKMLSNNQTVVTQQQQQQQQPRTILLNNGAFLQNQFLAATGGKGHTIYPATFQTTGTSAASNGQTAAGQILMSQPGGGLQVVTAAPNSQFLQFLPQQPIIFTSAPQQQQQQRAIAATTTNNTNATTTAAASTTATKSAATNATYITPDGHIISIPQQQQTAEQQQQQMNQFQQFQQQQLYRQWLNSVNSPQQQPQQTGQNVTPQQQQQLLNYQANYLASQQNILNFAAQQQQQQQLQQQPVTSQTSTKQTKASQQQQQQQQKPLAMKSSPVKNETLNLTTKKRNESPVNLKTSNQAQQNSTASTSSPSSYSNGGLSSCDSSPTTLKTANINDEKFKHKQQPQQPQLNKRQNSNPNLNNSDLNTTKEYNSKKHKLKTLSNENHCEGMDVDNVNGDHSIPSKRRGRPRLYVQDPVTGKSIKGQFLNEAGELQPLKETQSKSEPNGHHVTFDPQNDYSNDEEMKEEHEEAVKQEQSPPNKVLTHIIEGYVIKESSEPFPLKGQNPNVNDGYPKSSSSATQVKQQPVTLKNTPQKASQDSALCIECGKCDKNSKFKQFCSGTCSKQYSMKQNGQLKNLKNSNIKKSKKRLLDSKNQQESDDEEQQNGEAQALHRNTNINHFDNLMDVSLPNGYSKTTTSPKLNSFSTNSQQQQQQFNRSPLLTTTTTTTTANGHAIQTPTPAPTPPSSVVVAAATIDSDGYEIPYGNPIDWNCDQVYAFVKSIAGANVANTFKTQEVDGSALTLIKDDHLVNTMHIKLGPALKILYKFNDIRAKFK